MLRVCGKNKSAGCLRNIKFPVKTSRKLRLSFGMGCICSKGTKDDNKVKKEKVSKKSVNSSIKDEVVSEVENVGNEATLRLSNAAEKITREEGDKKSTVFEPSVAKQEKLEAGTNGGNTQICTVLNVRNGLDGSQVVAGWPLWLSSVAGEAIKGWIPRMSESFEKLDKIGQGTYSSVYRARDLETGKIVAMKKVRFVNMDPESVRFMAREILIIRRLDHPNVMKLEGLVTSRVSGNLYLVFEYMEHDLAGLTASPVVQFTESQIKCFMLQLLRGLEHCHARGVLHRDIKGSNLLIDNNGNLKIGDFGLATFFRANQIQKQPLTSRVVTLWYRPPELLLGSTDYGVAVDLWSSGCILAELFVRKPIMPGRTEVEQLHKIFKLCGSPSEEYWKNSKLVHSTIFKPQQPYKRRVAETFKDFPPCALSLLESLLAFEPELRGSTTSALHNEFFTTKPLPCDPSSLPKYPPSKEYDARARDEEARRESTRKSSKESKVVPAPDANSELPTSIQKWKGNSNPKSNSEMEEDGGPGFSTKASSGFLRNNNVGPSGNSSELRELKTQRSFKPQATAALKENNRGSALKKTRMHYSGPLLPPGGSVDEMLKEHEKQIQVAVRKARDKNMERKANGQNDSLLGYVNNGR